MILSSFYLGLVLVHYFIFVAYYILGIVEPQTIGVGNILLKHICIWTLYIYNVIYIIYIYIYILFIYDIYIYVYMYDIENEYYYINTTI